MIEIQNLHVTVEGKEILKGITLSIAKGKVHALMGPNGSGKSTLANVLMGHPKYTITKGKILIDGEDVTTASPDERAKKGLFLSFQYPQTIPGVTVTNVLRAAYNATHPPLSIPQFYSLLKEKMELLQMDATFAQRHLNSGFSGGEKKRAEILQLLTLDPKYALLDETDSGLDVDALKTVAEGIQLFQGKEKGILIITHYNRILEFIQPDVVTVLQQGKIVKTGGKDLARQIEQEGFNSL